jgi:tRNA pseudouridine38-40 synthase
VPTFKITVAYDGSEFVGWQRQANGVSIQGAIESALADLDGAAVAVAGAGRTDAGVHALGQVASFTLVRAIDAATVRRVLNATLPASIRVLAAEDVAPTFHARFAARSKTYRYRLFTGDVMNPFARAYAWHVAGPLDLDAMQRAARELEGAHDFAAFRAAGGEVRNTVREMFVSRIDVAKSAITEDTDTNGGHGQNKIAVPSVGGVRNRDLRGSALIVYEVTGNGFLRHMVRTIVGSLVEIGRGRRGEGWLASVVASRERAQAGPTAPAQGLFLVSVSYDVDALAAEP